MRSSLMSLLSAANRNLCCPKHTSTSAANKIFIHLFLLISMPPSFLMINVASFIFKQTMSISLLPQLLLMDTKVSKSLLYHYKGAPEFCANGVMHSQIFLQRIYDPF